MTKVYLKNQVNLNESNYDKDTKSYTVKIPTNYLGELTGTFTRLAAPKNFNGSNIVAEVKFNEIETKFPISIREGEFNGKKTYSGPIKKGDEKVAYINIYKKISESEVPTYDLVIAEVEKEIEKEDDELPF